MHEDQLNDLTASVCMAVYQGKEPTWRPPLPWTLGGSGNQKMEGAIGAWLLDPKNPVARKQLLDRLSDQKKNGHQWGEFGTNSHAPHWYRAMSMGMWGGLKYEDTEILNAINEWWAFDAWVRSQYYVPKGPLAGHVIGWGGRFAGSGDQEVRNVVDTLIRDAQMRSHNTPGVRPGAKYFSNAAKFKDTFGAMVVENLVQKGASFASIEIKPVIAYGLDIRRSSRGHVCICDNPAAGDPHRVEVVYETGQVLVGK